PGPARPRRCRRTVRPHVPPGRPAARRAAPRPDAAGVGRTRGHALTARWCDRAHAHHALRAPALRRPPSPAGRPGGGACLVALVAPPLDPACADAASPVACGTARRHSATCGPASRGVWYIV